MSTTANRGAQSTLPLSAPRTTRREEPSVSRREKKSRLPAFTLTWKIFLGTAFVVAAVLGALLAVTNRSAQRAADRSVDRTLAAASDQVQTVLTGRERSLAKGVSVFAQDPHFRSILTSHDSATYLDQANEGKQTVGATWIQITDADGVRLAKSDEPAAPRENLSESPLIGNALSGQITTGVGVSGDSVIFQSVAVPVVDPGNSNSPVYGVVMATQVIDSSLADSVKKATDGDVVFYALDRQNKPHIVASTIPRTPDLDAFLATRPASAPDTSGTPVRAEVKLGNEHYVGQGAPLLSAAGTALGGFLVLRSRDSELAGFTDLRNTILLGGALGIVVAFLLSYLLAHQITRPVNALVRATRAAAEGDYSIDIVTRGRDEIGQLADAFRQMLTDLREKQSLVEFLSASPGQGKTQPLAAAMSMTGQQMMQEIGDKIQPGSTFAGRYDVKEILGVGGMGMVFKAIDRELGETIAIKTLKPELVSQDPTALDRFRDEIRLARRISHRNVVRTHDIGEKAGVYYITMEYVEGTSLKDVIKTRGRLPVPAVLTIGKQLSRALETAHEQGVIHRDIKPQNIVIEADGVLKVMDFGIARLAQRTKGVTQAGMVIGTPEYMAPEQLLGDDVDPRADLYAAGVVLYECLTGRMPFEADSPITLITKVLDSEPAPPNALVTDIPPALNALVLRLLSRDRDARPHNAAELHDLIAEIG